MAKFVLAMGAVAFAGVPFSTPSSAGSVGLSVAGAQEPQEDPCDKCKGAVTFKVTPLPSWNYNSNNVLFGGVWGPDSDSVFGQCEFSSEDGCAQVGVGCSDSNTPMFGYNSFGCSTSILPPTTPPTPPVSGNNMATASSSLIWANTDCGTWGADGDGTGVDLFTIACGGSIVALVSVKGGCKTCDGGLPAW